MTRVCPRPCGRLTTAAVFIAVGVVQLLVGIILLRSRFSALLSGPDFMTASANIGIGCVYGMAASVWKSKKKQRSSRRTARNNVLASLLVSLITVNATTAVILIMGDGNKLLFAYMEALDRKSSAAFANEVLAGAYVTSVCSPIVCIVVAIVALSGSCFQAYGNKHKNLENVLDVESPFGWVSDPKTARPKLISDCLAETPTTSSDQSSRFSEDSVFSEKNTRSSFQQNSNTYIPSPVNTWAHKRKHILKHSKLLKKRSQIFDSCLPEPEVRQSSNNELIPRIKESSILKHQSHVEYVPPCCDSIKLIKEKRSNQSTSVGTALKEKMESKCSHGVRINDPSPQVRFDEHSPGCRDRSESSDSNEGKSEGTCSRNNSFEYISTQKSVPSDANYTRNDLEHVDDLALRHAEMHLLEKINPTLMKLKENTMRELKTLMQSIPSVEPTSEVISQKQQPSGILKQSEQSTGNPVVIPNASTSVSKATGNTENRFLAEDGKKLSSERVFLQKKVSSTKLPLGDLPLSDPMSESDASRKNKTKHLHNSILNGIKSKTFNFPQGEYHSTDENQCPEVAISSCLECNDQKKKRTNLVLDCPKVPSIKPQIKKRDSSMRMASITENPSEEAMDDDQNSAALHKSSTSKNPDTLLNRDENSNITLEQTITRQGISPDTVKRRKPSTSPSIKNMLKGIWSSSGPEAKLNILELIMDEDSLIGLSEEDLISRTQRIRALRKAVAERLKNEIEDETRMEREDLARSALSG